MSLVAVVARDVVRWINDYYLWAIGALTATLGLYLLLRQSFPKVAVVVAWPCRAGWWCLRLVYRVPRWFWHQAWLQKDTSGVRPVWVYRGPIARWREPRRVARRSEMVGWIAEVVDPQFKQTRDAARAQHDEQNIRFDDFGERLDRIEKYQADETGRRLDKVEGRVGQLEELVTQPPITAARPITKGRG